MGFLSASICGFNCFCRIAKWIRGSGATLAAGWHKIRTMVGCTLAHYTILEIIGAGGMGVVYRARDTQLERMVALKVVGERDQIDRQAQARLMREARTASVLNHSNICTVYEAGVSDGTTYIAMELVEGQSMNSIVSADRLPVETVIRYGIQIADALAHAHERGVVHRDLKCANVVIAPGGQLKVLDFGLAKRETQDVMRSIETITQTGVVMGTLPYMAPETLHGQPADARSDLWAMGVMLYRALTGSLPFTGTTPFQIGSAIQRDDPPPLPQSVPPSLAAIVQRLLAKQPNERYQSAEEVRVALQAIQPETTGSGALPVRTSRRRWLWVAASVAAAVLLLAAGVQLSGRWRGTTSPQPLSDGYRPSSNPQANDYYERALLFGPTGARAEPETLKRMLERALEADPKFAAARALHAWSLVLLLWGGISNDSGLLYKAEEGARRALQDDPHCGQAHSDLAVVYLLQGRKELFPGEAKQALEANPNDARVHTWRVLYHQINGDSDRAIQQAKEVISRAPMQWPPHMYLGDLLREQGDTAGAVREESRILEQESSNVAALGVLAQAYLDSGDLRQARQVLERASDEGRKGYRIRPAWALLLALEQKREEALREMDADVQLYAGAHVFGPLRAAEFYAVMGDSAKALEWLDRGVRMGDDREDWIRRDPHLASLRSQPRFQEMLASVAYRRKQRSQIPPDR
jgi:serine/threonine protein kinase/Flp pilus assembly protein TadD